MIDARNATDVAKVAAARNGDRWECLVCTLTCRYHDLSCTCSVEVLCEILNCAPGISPVTSYSGVKDTCSEMVSYP